jgi:hypothetical protein
MSTSYKLLVIGAVIMLAAMIGISSFSLGLYLGLHGDWPAGPLPVMGPGGFQRPGAPGGGPGGFQQPGAPGVGPQQPGAPGVGPQQPGAPGGGPQQPGSPGGGTLFTPPGPPDLVGRVRSASGDTLTIETPQGGRMVLVNEETEVRYAEGGVEASQEEIQRGSQLAVFGEFDADGRTLTAYLLLILPDKPGAP